MKKKKTSNRTTERKGMEPKAPESEAKFRMIFDQSPVGKAIVGLDKRFIRCNGAFCRFLGYPEDELVGKTIADITYPEDANLGMRELKEIVEGKAEASTVRKRYLRKDGAVVWGEVRICLVRNELKAPLYFLPVIQDITAQLKAEEALKKTSDLFRAMIDNAPLGAHLYELMPDDRLVFSGANQSADAILQVKNSRFVGKTIEEAFPNLAATDIPDTYRRVARTGVPFNMEQVVYADDRGISGAFEIAAFQTAPGKMAVLFRDITEKKKAQDALSASERRFKELVRNASDSVTVLDKDGIQIYVSDVVERMLGYKPVELMNIPVIEKMIHPEDRPRVEEAFRRIFLEGTANVQYRHRHKNGGWVHLEAWGTNQLDNPDIRGVVINVRDITERVLAAEEREKLSHQINQMQKLESLGLLAGGIAHDFNNLMGGIFGYIDLAAGCSKDAAVNGYLSKAVAAIYRARDLTQQLLTFAKGGAPVRKVDCLFPCVREAAEFALSGSNVSCRFDVPEDLWPCNFDRNQIGQVIDNIVINAQHAMPAGGAIELSARNTVLGGNGHPKLAGGNYVRISIRDHGIGIPNDLIPRIFDPFFTTKPKGHGLGLATCYSIINRHGGAIDVESEQGKGSVFHVYLPAAKEAASDGTAPSGIKHKGSGTIIIMDDEEMLRDAAKSMVEGLGYSAECAENGKDALDLLIGATRADRPIAGLILDLTVPGGMGGKEAVKEIRRLNPGIPVFVASGYADDPVMQNPAEYGFTASIRKPFTQNELAEVLSKYMVQP